jgi:chorismate mutase
MTILRKVLATLAVSIAGFTACQAQTEPKRDQENTLEIQRRKIDSLDKQLIEILGARQRAVKEIGIYKAQHHIPPLTAGPLPGGRKKKY